MTDEEEGRVVARLFAENSRCATTRSLIAMVYKIYNQRSWEPKNRNLISVDLFKGRLYAAGHE